MKTFLGYLFKNTHKNYINTCPPKFMSNLMCSVGEGDKDSKRRVWYKTNEFFIVLDYPYVHMMTTNLSRDGPVLLYYISNFMLCLISLPDGLDACLS